MEHIYEKVKSNSKFFKALEDYNLAANPTATGANPGANPGTLPVTPQAGAATGGIDPKVIAAQKAAQAAATKAQVDAAKKELDALKKSAPATAKATADRMKQLDTIIKNAGKMSAAAPV